LRLALLASPGAFRLLASLALVALLAWYYMFYGMSMNMKPVALWNFEDLAGLFVMWAIMMVAMMLPSALPTLLLIHRVNLQRVGVFIVWLFHWCSTICSFIPGYRL
jgi:hypothetical protein